MKYLIIASKNGSKFNREIVQKNSLDEANSAIDKLAHAGLQCLLYTLESTHSLEKIITTTKA